MNNSNTVEAVNGDLERTTRHFDNCIEIHNTYESRSHEQTLDNLFDVKNAVQHQHTLSERSHKATPRVEPSPPQDDQQCVANPAQASWVRPRDQKGRFVRCAKPATQKKVVKSNTRHTPQQARIPKTPQNPIRYGEGKLRRKRGIVNMLSSPDQAVPINGKLQKSNVGQQANFVHNQTQQADRRQPTKAKQQSLRLAPTEMSGLLTKSPGQQGRFDRWNSPE